MRKVFLLFLLPLCLGLMGMESCFPGDGYPNPDAFGVSGHGPALSYKDNGNGTFTDEVTKFIWEEKTGTPGTSVVCSDPDNPTGSCTDPHNVNNRYAWTDTTVGTNTDPDGTLFMLFLDQINNTCNGEGITECETHKDCGFLEKCGLGGHRDWCIPNVKVLQSIVDYSTCQGCDSDAVASSVPGETFASAGYWSSTTAAFSTGGAWSFAFDFGTVFNGGKSGHLFARAVRPCE